MIRIRPSRVDGTTRAPPSKSYTHRAFILAALSGNGLIRRPLLADDTRATLDGLHALGYLVTHEAAGTRVGGVLRPGKAPLDARESGTTLRLLTCIAALADAAVQIRGAPRLAERPLEPLLSALRRLGATIQREPDRFPFTIRGPLQGGTCQLPGDVSSQFVSGLLLAAPAAPQDTTIELTTPLTSRPYVDVTLAMLREHGIQVEEAKNHFVIPGRQRFRQRPTDVPGDYSSAAFLLSAAAVTGGNVTVDGLPAADEQGDRAILDHLASFGALVERDGERVRVSGGKLRAARIHVGATPDLFPVLCAVAACADGTSVLEGAPHLRGKESDRILAMHESLQRFGIQSEERPDGLVVHGGRPRACAIQSSNDHRVAMAGVVLALAAVGESTLEDPHVAAKSYPNFLQDLTALAPGVAA